MNWLLLALGVWIVTGVAAWMGQRHPRWASGVAAAGVVLGALLSFIPALQVLLGAAPESLRWPWAIPYGEFHLELDALSAWFVLAIAVLSALAAIYGVEYLAPWRKQKPLGPAWFFFNGLVASMVLVVLAQNAVLFLMAWEVMALTSFFLVTFEDERGPVREAGWVYLVATHLGTAFLLVIFLLLGRETGSMDFNIWTEHARFAPSLAGLLFVLAVIGFGAKAGFMPFHVWLPEAHPAAPCHVSALMSGVMIKTGIYGLLRTLTFLGPLPAWCGWVLIGIGLTSGVLGVLFALAQHDLKRLLAYHSVENIGIIALGMGVGLVGLTANAPVMVLLGFGGALLHVLNHAVFKGLLFLGAGSILHGTGTRNLEHLGGLQKRMPWTGITFLIGAMAISGLPPLNGFVSELLIFLGAYQGVISQGAALAAPALAVIAGLALIGGLAAACFAKAYGIAFLGEPRSEHAAHAHECGGTMRWPMVFLAAACVGLGLLGFLVIQVLPPVVAVITRLPVQSFGNALIGASHILELVTIASLVLLALIAGLILLRRGLLKNRNVTTVVTWDCGYAQPAVRMQYTASSFAQPLTSLFRPLLQTHNRLTKPDGFFPRTASLATETPDLCHGNLYRPAFLKLNWALSKLRWLQRGHVQVYIVYIALTLLVLLIWKLH